MSLRVRFSVLCMVILAMPAFAAPPSGSDLSGTYLTSVQSPNERVVVKQFKDIGGDPKVSATYESPHKCGDTTITELFDVPLKGGVLSGTMTLCSTLPKLVSKEDCSLPVTFKVEFKLTVQLKGKDGDRVSDVDTISGQYLADYVTYDKTKDGHWTNCKVRPGGGGEESFYLIPATQQKPTRHQKR